MMVSLDVYDGDRRRTVDVNADVVRIGRGDECELVLPGDATVSRKHAALRAVGGGWLLEDLGSRNGTYLNGARLIEPAPVKPADRVLIGDYVVVLRSSEDEQLETRAADGVRSAAETGLSRREVEVLRLICAGRSDQQIADELFVSIKTVHSHLDRIRDKTGARRRPELVRYGIAHGLA